MAILNLTEAAKQAGIGRTTLWRKAKSGALSTTTFPDGSPGVDTAELFRVFPPETVERSTEKHDGTETEQMKQEIKHLHEVIHLKEQVIETQAQALRLLEHRPAVVPVGPETPAADPVALAKVAELAVKLQEQGAIIEAERTRAAELEAQLTAERSKGFFARLFGK